MADGSSAEHPDSDAGQARLQALREAGLTASSDADMERFAQLVARSLRVPMSLVSLVGEDRQVFPGMVGLAEPWATRRETPLTHSLCQHVIATGRPLVLPDARRDARTCDSLAIPDLGVVAYAGMPLTDGNGHVLGSLCAIDTTVRQWTPRELQDLADLAAACSAELRLRIVSQHAVYAQGLAEDARREAESARAAAELARREAEEARGLAQGLARTAHQALKSAELLLRAAEDLTGTTSVEDVRRQVGELVSGDLKPTYVGLILLEGDQLRRVQDPDAPHAVESDFEVFGLDADFPTARALRERRMITVPDRAHMMSRYGPDAVDGFDSLGLQSAVCLPLSATRGPVGVLILGWGEPHAVDLQESAVLTSVAGYTAQAVERAVFLGERINVAHQLQRAMLTDLPAVAYLDCAALYLPAAIDDMVGGDWYDSFPLPTAPGHGPALAVTVGDITGHDVHAAAIMGQVRSMLRQSVLDHPAQGPAAALSALEQACATLSLHASGTVVHAHLERQGDAWSLTWTNAGHPPPLLLHPDGRTTLLDQHDMMLYPGLDHAPRADHHLLLEPGSTLLLYTDGLVERRDRGITASLERTAELLAAHRDLPLPQLLQRLAREVAGPDNSDDMVLLALRTDGGVPRRRFRRARTARAAPASAPEEGAQ
ncbi:SpoIIE family protein phosphatase [Streptomyces sp. H10-C2]|uniref:GAF domain-containing SpoIIE family protein phosphatase n=1 Tax=unclassified Streptomyces TaxID=2593676 RepID=UPI0024BA3384|nr:MULTISPECIES: SpoIIE family protein phosphatase [unclassified Streptomyces]MDJ0344080.1 SpoIIE family protein phosphatase [Streptomyces sp. PH10-H1]MDJ0368619.1 SpoIIE family protein phosphatase [Streptomyces sp. H10-C2]